MSVDLTLKQGSNLPLKRGWWGGGGAYWCFSYKSTSRKPWQKCCTTSQWISSGATARDRGEGTGYKREGERGRKTEEVWKEEEEGKRGEEMG